jgi:hypothetical protein
MLYADAAARGIPDTALSGWGLTVTLEGAYGVSSAPDFDLAFRHKTEYADLGSTGKPSRLQH